MNVLFVCTGNICRSPLAEGILKETYRKLGINGLVDSAGFESFHIGDRPDPRARQVAREHGIDISGHVARLFTPQDFDRFDRIYVMDAWHYQKVTRLIRDESDLDKVDFVMSAVYPGKKVYVDDPYYEEYEAFEKVYRQLDQACEKIAEIARYADKE